MYGSCILGKLLVYPSAFANRNCTGHNAHFPCPDSNTCGYYLPSKIFGIMHLTS